MIPAALIPWLIRGAAVLTLAASLFAAGYRTGGNSVRADWTADKLTLAAKANAAMIKAVSERDAANNKAIQTTNEVTESYVHKLAEKDDVIVAERIRADSHSMRITLPAASDCPAPAGQTTSPIAPDGAETTVEIELPAAVASNLRDLAEDADREVADLQTTLDSLREWVRKQGFYGPDRAAPEQ